MIMRRYKQVVGAGVFICLLFLLLTSGFGRAVSAAEGESIVLSPASERIEINAGEVIADTVKVINDGTTTYDFVVYASPYSVADKTYKPNYDEVKANTDLYTWVTYDKKQYTLNPGESVDVPYKMTVPSDAAPGGHYGVLFAETQVPDGQNGQISRKKRVGTIIYATVKGDYVTAGRQVAVTTDWLQIGGVITSRLTTENTGNTDFIMTERMQIKNVFGKQVHETTKERILLPKTTRDSVLTWDNGPAIGLYNVTVETVILGKTATTSSWALLLPAWLLIVVVLGIAAGTFWLFRRKR